MRHILISLRLLSANLKIMGTKMVVHSDQPEFQSVSALPPDFKVTLTAHCISISKHFKRLISETAPCLNIKHILVKRVTIYYNNLISSFSYFSASFTTFARPHAPAG